MKRYTELITETIHGKSPLSLEPKFGSSDSNYQRFNKHIENLHDSLSGHYKFDNEEHGHIYEYSKYTPNAYLHDLANVSKHAYWNLDASKVNKWDSKRTNNHIRTLSSVLTKHSAPRDLHVYTGLKIDHNDPRNIHPFDGSARGLSHINQRNNKSPIKAFLPAFTSTSIHPGVAKSFAAEHWTDLWSGGTGIAHILKLHIPKGSKHGAYIGHHSDFNNEKEFLLDRGHHIHIHPEPEDHYGNNIIHRVWHAHIVPRKKDENK